MEIAKRKVHILFHRHVKPIIRRMSSSSVSLPEADLALPRDSQILVTGASGFVGSHVVREALDQGFRVRGTVRSEEKARAVEEVFSDPKFSTCIVEDLADPQSLDEAVQDCVGIIHTASDTSLNPDPTVVVPRTVAMATSVLKAAKKAGTCTRFVFTSSSSAVAMPKPDTKFRMDKDTWNTETAEKVRAMQPPFPPEGFADVYAASKIEAERAVWKFVEDEKPSFTVNTIIPNTNVGRVLIKPATSSARFVLAILNGGIQRIAAIPPQWMINVDDDARIHLGALMDKTVANERVFAFGQPFDWNDMRQAVRKEMPDAPVGEELPPHGKDVSEVDNSLARELLRKWFGQAQFTTLEESVRENLEGYGEPSEKS
jgi:nucleoside-diphosphate-sugar epimerase